MTPEHKFTLWATALTAIPTLALATAVAYWTWRRDQERVIVKKVPLYWETLDPTREGPISTIGIMVINLSLFPVRIAGLCFRISNTRNIVLDRSKHKEDWPPEIVSQGRIVIYANDQEWNELKALGATKRVMDWDFVAIALTETGSRFSSNRISVNMMRPLRACRRELSKIMNRGR